MNESKNILTYEPSLNITLYEFSCLFFLVKGEWEYLEQMSLCLSDMILKAMEKKTEPAICFGNINLANE